MQLIQLIDVAFMEWSSIDPALHMVGHRQIKQGFGSSVVGIPGIFVIVNTQFHDVLLLETERSGIEEDAFNALGGNYGAKISIGFECHNKILRRFIPKGKSMVNYSQNDIDYFADIINGLPRRILSYKTPDELFDRELDLIYSTQAA